jgi:hypothetical protein
VGKRGLSGGVAFGESLALALVCWLLVIASMANTCMAKTDPVTGRIRLVTVGNQWQNVNQYALSLLRSDPRILFVASIETSNGLLPDDVRKRARINFPRSRARLSSNVDVIQLMFAPPWVFSDDQQRWIHDSVYQDGVGLVLIHMGWQPCLTDPMLYCNRPEDWVNSVIYDSWPMDVVVGVSSKPGVGLRIVTETAVVGLPDFEKQPIGFRDSTSGAGLIVARPGAAVHAKWKAGGEDAIVSTRYGQGTTLSLPIMDFMFTNAAIRNWKYHIDFVLNRIYYAADVPVPEDLELGHTLRAGLTAFYEQRNMMMSLIDFIERFGANTASLHSLLDELEGRRDEASRLYLKGSYQESLDAVQLALDGLIGITAESAKLRREALFWVYLTEYLVFSGASMISGFVLWTVMIRRRYYREVGTTRLTQTQS